MNLGNCKHCNQQAKYRCPTCRELYCSMACCKKHKEVPCTAPPTETLETQPQTQYELPTEDTVAPEKLNLLASSKQLKELMYNPHLRNILELLDNSPCPDIVIQDYMQEPLFTEFVDECLKIVEPKQDCDNL